MKKLVKFWCHIIFGAMILILDLSILIHKLLRYPFWCDRSNLCYSSQRTNKFWYWNLRNYPSTEWNLGKMEVIQCHFQAMLFQVRNTHIPDHNFIRRSPLFITSVSPYNMRYIITKNQAHFLGQENGWISYQFLLKFEVRHICFALSEPISSRA